MGGLADASAECDKQAVLDLEAKEDTIPGASIGIFRDTNPDFMLLRLYDGIQVELVLEELKVNKTAALESYWESLAQDTVDETIRQGYEGSTDLEEIRAASYVTSQDGPSSRADACGGLGV